jgi:hypothetical protein
LAGCPAGRRGGLSSETDSTAAVGFPPSPVPVGSGGRPAARCPKLRNPCLNGVVSWCAHSTPGLGHWLTHGRRDADCRNPDPGNQARSSPVRGRRRVRQDPLTDTLLNAAISGAATLPAREQGGPGHRLSAETLFADAGAAAILPGQSAP